MAPVAIDTWAFVEILSDGPRRAEVQRLLDAASHVFTVREVVAETFNLIASRRKSTEPAWSWWLALAASRVEVVEFPLAEIREFASVPSRRRGDLGFTELALALAAERQGTIEIASEDAGFWSVGCRPMFARGRDPTRRPSPTS